MSISTILRPLSVRALLVTTVCSGLLCAGLHARMARLTVGLHLIPHPAGGISCTWEDDSGTTHTLGTCSTETGQVSFPIPIQAKLFRFHFSPSREPYRITGLSLFHLQLLNAQWLNNMLTPEHPVYTQQYMGKRDRLEIIATEATSLTYPRFFSTLLHFTRGLRAAIPVLLFGLLFLPLGLKLRFCGARLPLSLPRGFYPDMEGMPLRKGGRPVFLLFVAALLLCLPNPVAPTTPGCDASWSWMLNHFALNPSGVGTSFFFTYGPLGFTITPEAIRSNAYWALTFSLLYILLVSATIHIILTQHEKPSTCAVPLLLCVLLLPPNTEWRWAFLINLMLATCLFFPAEQTRARAVYSAVTGAVILYASFIKVSLAITAGLNVLMVLFLLLPYRRRDLWFFGVPLAGGFLTGLLIVRSILFPSFSSILTWARLSWEIASGYNTAMVTQVTWPELIIPAVLVASFLVLLFPFHSFSLQRLRRMALVSTTLFLVFKYSMTRAGIGTLYAVTYVVPCMTGILMLFADSLWRPNLARLFRLQLAACVGLSVLTGVFLQLPIIGFNHKNLLESLRLNQCIARARIRSCQALLDVRLPPHWIRQIGNETFTSYPTELTYSPANSLQFIPFPIVQGYTAYTRDLDVHGASLFSGPQAPEWLLCAFSKPDQRNGVVDTPAVWNTIRTHYRLEDVNEHGVLLQHRTHAEIPQWRCVRQQTAAVGEWIDLTGKDMVNTYLSITWPPTLLGKGLGLLFRNTQCSFTLIRADGTTHRWRLVPDTASTPFPIGAIPFTEHEFPRIFDNPDSTPFPVSRIKFECEHPWYYSREITLSFFSATFSDEACLPRADARSF